ncbi:MAG TPA: PAS domain-containing protein, partial [Spirochaetota bacterium]
MPNGKTHIEYGQIGNQIHSLVVRIDPFGTIIYLNDIAQTFFGYPRDALINQNIFGTIIEEQPKDRERLRSLVARVVHDPKVPVFAEIEARKADHERSWISFSITPHFEDGQLRDLVCVGNDVSDSKHLEIELRETNDRFKVMLENVQTGVIILDPDEKIILYANYEAAKIIGVDRDQIVGESCDHWCLEMVSACDTLKTNDTENIHHSETFIDRPGGTRIHVYLSATYIFFRGNGYILASFIDISEQKHTEDKLLNASRQIEELLSSIVSVLIGVSIDDYVTHWNKAAEEMFGVPEQDVIGKRFPLCPVEWDWRRIYEGIANSILTNKVIKLRGLKFKSRDGKEGFLDTTINPILDKSKKVTGYIIFGEDATDRQMNKILVEEIERRKKA